jgi:carbonic anhydrase/acetyltransferase-like protein (isoleucine patch superfamily)
MPSFKGGDMPVYEFNGKTPVIGEGTWIGPGACIIGEVTIGKNCWIGPNAVIRGDFGRIVIGDETAVEDGAVIHTPSSVFIGSRVTIGHLAMVHGSSIGDNAVIGMNSTMGDNTQVGRWSIVAEHSLVKKNQVIPDYKLYAGSPAVEKGDIHEKYQEIMAIGKQMYVDLVAQYRKGFRIIDPAQR